MTQGASTTTMVADDSEDLVMLINVMRASGLPRDTIESFLISDDDLDSLCDSVLSELAVPTKKVAGSAR